MPNPGAWNSPQPKAASPCRKGFRKGIEKPKQRTAMSKRASDHHPSDCFPAELFRIGPCKSSLKLEFRNQKVEPSCCDFLGDDVGCSISRGTSQTLKGMSPTASLKRAQGGTFPQGSQYFPKHHPTSTTLISLNPPFFDEISSMIVVVGKATATCKFRQPYPRNSANALQNICGEQQRKASPASPWTRRLRVWNFQSRGLILGH